MPMSPRKQRSVSHEDSTAQQGTSSTKPLVAKNHCCKLLKGGYHCCLFNFNHRFINKHTTINIHKTVNIFLFISFYIYFGCFRVPLKVIWWALRKLDVEEWIVRLVKGMFANA